MKQFAIALLAAAASALDSEHYHQTRTYQPATRYTGSTYGKPQQYGSYSYQKPTYGGYYHSPNHSHDPFNYSRPQIPYVAAKLTAPVYATCNINDTDQSDDISLKFG